MLAYGDRLIIGAGANAEIYDRDRNASTWTGVLFGTFIPTGLDMTSLYHHGDTIFGGAANEFYISTDSARSWIPYLTGRDFVSDGAFATAGLASSAH